MSRGVQVRKACHAVALKMALVDILSRLWVENVQLLCKSLEVLGHLGAIQTLHDFPLVIGIRRQIQYNLLFGDQESHLFLERHVLGRIEILLNERNVVEANSEHDGLGELAIMLVDIVRGSEELLIFWVGQETDHAHHVQADSWVCIFIEEFGDILDDFQLAHQVHSVGFGIALEEQRDKN